MKRVNLLLCTILLMIAASSCHHSSEQLYFPMEVKQLNTAVAPWQRDNDLLPLEEGFYKLYIINSVEEIYATQTEKFISENPDWLRVDFSKNTIIAFRNILFAYDSWLSTNILYFSEYNGEDDPTIDMKKGGYHLALQNVYYRHQIDSDEDEERQMRICQVALITDKIPSDAIIRITQSTRIEENQE